MLRTASDFEHLPTGTNPSTFKREHVNNPVLTPDQTTTSPAGPLRKPVANPVISQFNKQNHGSGSKKWEADDSTNWSQSQDNFNIQELMSHNESLGQSHFMDTNAHLGRANLLSEMMQTGEEFGMPESNAQKFLKKKPSNSRFMPGKFRLSVVVMS